MDLFDVILAKKMTGGSGGGGGGGDFSTAEVTVNGDLSIYDCILPYCADVGAGDMLYCAPYPFANDTYAIALYKGQCAVVIEGVASVSGNITSMGNNYYLITGDCTITIS